MKGGAHTLRSPHILASNGLIHGEIVSLFGDIFGGRAKYPLPEIHREE
jgi:hypothetical protein